MKRTLITILCTIGIIAAVAAIAITTKVDIPSGAANKISVYTRNKPNAQITIAMIQGDETEVSAYGHDGVSIEVPDREYEIGDITKTFVGALTAKAVLEEHLSLSDSANDYLSLPSGVYSPTIADLVTHTSAYGDYTPASVSEIAGFFKSNPYRGFTEQDMLNAMENFRLNRKPPYFYSDSDFGTAILGNILSKVYSTDTCSLLTAFVSGDLGLENTSPAIDSSVQSGMKWSSDDVYLSSLGFTSTIDDLCSYAEEYISGEYSYLTFAATPMREINVENSVGCMWNVTNSNTIHVSGETKHYSAVMIVDRIAGNAVIVLSNYPSDRYGSVSDIAWALFDSMEDSGDTPEIVVEEQIPSSAEAKDDSAV